MTMKFLLATLLLLQALSAEILLQPYDPIEIPQLQSTILRFYSEELVRAGLFTNIESAFQAAYAEECAETPNPDRKIFYNHLIHSDSNEQIGYLVYWYESKDAYLDVIYLEEAYRSKGLGKQILENLEASLQARGIETLKLYVFTHNLRAFTLYQKMDYEIETTYKEKGISIGHHMKKTF